MEYTCRISKILKPLYFQQYIDQPFFDYYYYVTITIRPK